jgi:hypothetical protein
MLLLNGEDNSPCGWLDYLNAFYAYELLSFSSDMFILGCLSFHKLFYIFFITV